MSRCSRTVRSENRISYEKTRNREHRQQQSENPLTTRVLEISKEGKTMRMKNRIDERPTDYDSKHTNDSKTNKKNVKTQREPTIQTQTKRETQQCPSMRVTHELRANPNSILDPQEKPDDEDAKWKTDERPTDYNSKTKGNNNWRKKIQNITRGGKGRRRG